MQSRAVSARLLCPILIPIPFFEWLLLISVLVPCVSFAGPVYQPARTFCFDQHEGLAFENRQRTFSNSLFYYPFFVQMSGINDIQAIAAIRFLEVSATLDQAIQQFLSRAGR